MIRKTIALPFLLLFVIGCIFAVDMPSASANVNDGLVAYYTFDGDLNDSSGNGNNGSGTVEFEDAKFGKGVFLDGSNYVTVKDNDSLDLTEDFTFAVWLYKEESDQFNIPILRKGKSDDFFKGPYSFFLGSGGKIPGVYLVDENERDWAELYGDGEVIGTQNWTHVAVTKKGSSVRFYKNGKACGDAEADYVGTLLSNSQNLIIGMDAYNRSYYKGIMDELRIYNKALTDAEIKALYESTPGAATTPAAPTTTPGAKVTMILQIDNPMATVNGVNKEIDPGYGTKPMLYNGRVVLPIKILIESLGGRISWDQGERKTTITLGDTNLEFWIDKNQFKVNGVTKNSDVAPKIINSRTFLPLRVIIENLGCSVVWNPQDKTVTIVSGN